MGTDAGVLGIYISVLTLLGGGFDSYGVLLGACIIGGFVEVIIGCFYKYVEKLFPPVVIGVVLTAIGISLIPVGVNTFCGGDGASDFGSTANLFLAGLVPLLCADLPVCIKASSATSLCCWPSPSAISRRLL